MYKNYLLFWFLAFCFFKTFSQEIRKGFLYPDKIGFLYNYGTEENFIFNDKDYSYSTNTFKSQFFYKLGKWKNLNIELIVQPQVQLLKHQLLNPSFVQPRHGVNYLELRNIYIKQKHINLYALEFGLAAKKELTKSIELQGTISLGLSYISTTTERLTEGFTFLENFSLGLSFKTFKKTYFYVGTNFGHVSNLNFQKPNDGYNILGLEIGVSYKFK